MAVLISSDGQRVTLGPGVVPKPIPLWAHFKVGAHALCDAAVVAKVQAIFDDPDADIAMSSSFQADLALGDNTVFRPISTYTSATDVGLYNIQRSSGIPGRGAVVIKKDTATPSHTSVNTPETVIDGDEHHMTITDVSASSTAQLASRVDGGSANNLTTYDRLQILTIGFVTAAGSVRNITPDIFSFLGWVYYTIMVGANISSVTAAMHAAKIAAPNPLEGYLAQLAILEVAGFNDDIIFAQAFVEGRDADFGGSTIVGVTDFTLPGVAP